MHLPANAPIEEGNVHIVNCKQKKQATSQDYSDFTLFNQPTGGWLSKSQ